MTRLLSPRAYVAILAGVLSLTPVWSWAGTTQVAYSGGTLTITTPESYTSCSPSDTIVITGVTEGHPVTITFHRYDETLNWVFTLGSVIVESDGSYQFPYPAITGTMWFFLSVYDDQADQPIKAGVGKWSITCEPTTGTQGCTPGYWRNHYASWPAPYIPTGSFNAAFGVAANFWGLGFFSDSYTLGQAIWQGGGGFNRLARHGAAALLSAASSSVDYPYSVEQVIAMVRTGTIDPLAQANELGCPLK